MNEKDHDDIVHKAQAPFMDESKYIPPLKCSGCGSPKPSFAFSVFGAVIDEFDKELLYCSGMNELMSFRVISLCESCQVELLAAISAFVAKVQPCENR